MEGYKHFSHPHTLSFHQSLEDAQITCTGCNFPCTDTAVYSCHACNFFLHDQCFNATRSLTHPSHPDHPLSLFPSPTYISGSFICKLCDEIGSGFCFGCSACDYDLHIHCAYNTLNPKPSSNPPSNQIILESQSNEDALSLLNANLNIEHSSLNPEPTSNPPPTQIKLKSHPKHPLNLYLHKSACRGCTCFCDVCGTATDPDDALYRCDICNYGLHVGCASLPETVRREDHEHELSLLYVNPNPEYTCDVCRGEIIQKNCMYFCTSGCDYGTHVKCVSDKVLERDWMDEMTFNMSKLHNKMRTLTQSHWPLAIMVVIVAILFVTIKNRSYYADPYHQQYASYSYCDGTRCVYHYRR